MITAISINTLTEFFLREEIDHLGKNGLPLVHFEVPFAYYFAKKIPQNQISGKFKSTPLKFANINYIFIYLSRIHKILTGQQ